MTDSRQDQRYVRLARTLHPTSTLVRARALRGGVSAEVTALEVLLPDGQTMKLLVRRHGQVDRASNPDIAATEFALLHALHAAGLPVSSPIYLDTSCEIFPTPYIVVEYVDGAPEVAPSDLTDLTNQLAAQLARIHTISPSTTALPVLPDQQAIFTHLLAAGMHSSDAPDIELAIRTTLHPLWPLPQHNASVLLHGDLWPGNIIWKDNRLAAIIDWEDARIGDPLGDLANTRLELLWAYGVDAMHAFTNRYAAITSINAANLPYWDLCAALRPAAKVSEWANDVVRERHMRQGLALFVSQALKALSVRTPA
jgi:aminoglycoside phosphotransferase (APT) family kinase protein